MTSRVMACPKPSGDTSFEAIDAENIPSCRTCKRLLASLLLISVPDPVRLRKGAIPLNDLVQHSVE